jgi:hypothetical protein
MKSVNIRQIENGFIVTTSGDPAVGPRTSAEKYVAPEDLATFLAEFFAAEPV